MATLKQCALKARKPKQKLNVVPILRGNPHRKAICVKIFTRSPKKPNSGVRKVTKVKLSSLRGKMKRLQVESYICGEGHTLHAYSAVLIRGGRVRDLPGVRYHNVRGALDFKGQDTRITSRSKYGTKRDLKK